LECKNNELHYQNDDGTIETQDINEVKSMINQVMPLLQYINDWEKGLFHLSETEYLDKPSIIIDIRNILNEVRQQVNKSKIDLEKYKR
jgi:hypothetical protein